VCSRPRHQLVLVVAAPGSAAATAGTIATLGALGVSEPDERTARLFSTWAAMAPCGTNDSRAGTNDSRAGTNDSRAGTNDSRAEISGPVFWVLPAAADITALCSRADQAGWDVLTVFAWQPPDRFIATTARNLATPAGSTATDVGSPAPGAIPAGAAVPEALARWELTNRAHLAGLQGRPVVIIEVDDGHVDPKATDLLVRTLAEFLPGAGSGRGPSGGTASSPDPGARTTAAKTQSPGAPGSGEILAAQQELADALRRLAGFHRSFEVPDLAPPSSWALALFAAHEQAQRATADATDAWRHAAARGEDAEALWQALWQVGDQLADTVASTLPPPSVPPYGPDATGDQHGYRAWIAQRETPPGPPGSAPAANPMLATGPLISVVVPIYKPDLGLLRAAVASVQRQTYDRWELCLCDDGSGDPAVTAALAAYDAADPRIRVTALAANGGISAATNGALTLAQGAWVAFMDQDDELAAGALAAVAAAVVADPTVDLVYTDDDKIDREGRRFGPQFKPDWSPDLLLSMCYFSHLVAMRRSLVDEVGGLRSAFDGGQDWDLALRVSERARTVHHIPQVLYHWRAIPGSAALDSSYKPWAYEAARRALVDALQRRGEPGTVDHHPRFRGLYHVRRDVTGRPLVSIVIPFRDGAAMLQRCVDSLVVDPGYDRFELVLVDNGSTEPELLALLDRLSGDDRVTILTDPRPFNWAALNNAAINQCRGDMVLTLNNDITASSSGWLRELVSHAQRPEVGAVGARLLYPDGRVQHVGAAIGLGGVVAHPMRGLPGDHPGYMGFATVIRNWSAVTGACLLARRDVVDDVGGFDERLAVAFNDVDFCLKVVEAGYRIVFTPLAEMVHAESSTRGFTGYGADIDPFVTRWADWLRGEDPMFSPHLSRLDARCVVRLADEDPQWAALLQRIGLAPVEAR